MARPRVIVVGAGVAGLTAAYRLQQQGCEVTVLEAAAQVGGKTASIRKDGFIVNTGATVLAGSYDAMFDLAREVGVADRLFTPPAVIGVVRDGTVHELRGQGLGAIADFLRTPLLSARSKLTLVRATADILRARTRVGYDRPDLRAELDTETVAAYCERRLNAEIRDHLFDPVLGGIFVVEGKNLSIVDLWFTLWKVLLGGLCGYRGGMDFFARAVAAELDVRTDAPVVRVVRDGDGALVRWDDADGPHEERVDGVVLAVDAVQATRLFPELNPALQELMLEGLEQANFVSLRLGLSRRPTTRSLLTVAGSGALGGIATISYEHNLSAGCAPDGKGLLGILLYHEWATPRLGLTDGELLDAVLLSLERVEPGIADILEFAEITRWTPAAIKGTHGTHRVIARVDGLIDPADRVQLAGDYLGVVSVNGSIVSGNATARRLGASLR
ncbi:Renalase [Paraconexibacter sp. AEG42_29]|uniref:Renalase n=1 Tax=Paraconexibacter sp. AEG42_29 TaxID=2997339 RepID=A0AAU7B115_9ACTN